MVEIKKIKAREVLDSRGNPTVEVDVTTENGLFRAMTPSGASAGQHEALELRDNDNKRYLGKGTLKAVKHVNEDIAPKLIGLDCKHQETIDNIMIKLDGSENKEKFGANAILPISMAIAKAGAAAKHIPPYVYIAELFGVIPHMMPVPMCNVINGGKHAGQENSIQEHMLMPTGAKSFSQGIQMISETYHHLSGLLKDSYGAGATLIGDEGGFAPSQLTKIEQRFELMLNAVELAGYEGLMKIALDPASSEFFKDEVYTIGKKKYSGDELVDFYSELCNKYPIISIEDGLAEDDWETWPKLTKKIGTEVQIVGDDLFVTNTKRIKKGIDLKAANSVLIKLNQIGTVTETLDAIKMAHDAGWTAVVSHRSGETEDTFIADLVVGTSAGQIKTGAPARSDRNAKYNQLIRIEEELGEEAEYSGIDFRMDHLA
ncbi:MAG: phosphopyruvate hydratase [Candidatus Thermoplasmatota archaeon]|nr:phosphopyruvate hydratase [Candidatus Thermoplasmatota archaeon]